MKRLFCLTLSCLSFLAFGQETKKWKVSSFGLDMTTYDVPVPYTLEQVLGMTEAPSKLKGLLKIRLSVMLNTKMFPLIFI